MSRTCATTRWPERPGIGAPENESGATGLLAGVSGLDVIVGGRACARAGRCGGFDFGALGRDDLNRRGLAGMKQAVVLGSHQFTEKRN